METDGCTSAAGASSCTASAPAKTLHVLFVCVCVYLIGRVLSTPTCSLFPQRVKCVLCFSFINCLYTLVCPENVKPPVSACVARERERFLLLLSWALVNKSVGYGHYDY